MDDRYAYKLLVSSKLLPLSLFVEVVFAALDVEWNMKECTCGKIISVVGMTINAAIVQGVSRG